MIFHGIWSVKRNQIEFISKETAYQFASPYQHLTLAQGKFISGADFCDWARHEKAMTNRFGTIARNRDSRPTKQTTTHCDCAGMDQNCWLKQESNSMKNATKNLLKAFDGHDTDGVRAALESGADACMPVRGKPPILWLLEEYTRSERLGDCLRLLFEWGAQLDDPELTPVLLNDSKAIREAAGHRPALLSHRTSLVSAFTSLHGVTLLHVAAEYGNLDAARALVQAGADVNAPAEVDENGLNGHTPLFHTVNSPHNRSQPIMQILLEAGARTDVRLAGLNWGKGYPWETTFFDVTPISFAQMGLMPQVHRNEQHIYSNIRKLLDFSGRQCPPLTNIPNRYLQPK